MSVSLKFRIGQRVHSAGDCRRIGTVKYEGQVEGYSGKWVGVDWDNGDGKHDGSVNEVRYFYAKSDKSASFVRPHNLSAGITLLQALEIRYKCTSTKEEEGIHLFFTSFSFARRWMFANYFDICRTQSCAWKPNDEMYVFSASNRRVSVQLLGVDKIQDKLSRFEELAGASLPYLGIISSGPPCQISATMPSLKELDLSGNLLSDWKEVGTICEGLPALAALNLTNNLMAHDIIGLPQLRNVRVLVLNNTGIKWMQVEILKWSLPVIEELHLMGNKLNVIAPPSSNTVQGFDSLRLLNLEDNCIADWNEILKLSQLKSLEQLHLNKNRIKHIWHPEYDSGHDQHSCESVDNSCRPFQNLRCLLLGGNDIDDLPSVDSLNYFPNLKDIRLSENPIADPGRGGMPRFVLIARLGQVEMLNGSEVSRRERKDSEIRYVRLVMSRLHEHPEELLMMLHPRFLELKEFHGIEDEKTYTGAAAPQKMASGLFCITLKCVGASICEKPPLKKKLPAATRVGKLKTLCEGFFKLKSVKPVLFLKEEGSPFPTLLDDDMLSLIDVGVGNESTVLVDE